MVPLSVTAVAIANQVNVGREREIHNGAVGMITILFGKVLGKSCTETKGSMERDFRPLLWHGLRTVVHKSERECATRLRLKMSSYGFRSRISLSLA